MAKWIWKKYETKKNVKYKLEFKTIDKYSELFSDFSSGLGGYKRQTFYKTAFINASGKVDVKDPFDVIIYSGASKSSGIYHKKYDKVYLGDVEGAPGAYGIEFVSYKECVAKEEITYSQGSYIGEVTADYNAYTNNARNSDGYWYVRDRIANIFYNQNKPINKFYSQNKLLKVRQENKEWWKIEI